MFNRVTFDTAELKKAIGNTRASEFCKRNIYLDLDGSVFDYIGSKKSDYLIMDLSEIRLPMLKKEDESISFRPYYTEGETLKKYLCKLGFRVMEIEELQRKDIEVSLELLCKNIEKYWDPEHVILIEDCFVRNYITKKDRRINNEYLERFNKVFKCGRYLRYANKYVKEYLQCKVVSMPDDVQFVMADGQNDWGPYPLHYTKKTYEYFYDAICSIVFEGQYISKRDEILKEIKEEYYTALGKKVMNCNKPLSEEELDCLASDSVVEYLHNIKSLRGCMVIIAIKDTVGAFYGEKIQTELLGIGLVENLIKMGGVGYIAVIVDGVVIHERRSEKNGIEKYNSEIDYWKLNIESKPFKNGNKASICINGEEYAVNNRGFNIVLFDLIRGKVVDSVAFDTNTAEMKCTRKNYLVYNEDAVRIDIRKLAKKIDLILER